VLRFLVFRLDKYAAEYAEKRRNRAKTPATTVATEEAKEN